MNFPLTLSHKALSLNTNPNPWYRSNELKPLLLGSTTFKALFVSATLLSCESNWDSFRDLRGIICQTRTKTKCRLQRVKLSQRFDFGGEWTSQTTSLSQSPTLLTRWLVWGYLSSLCPWDGLRCHPRWRLSTERRTRGSTMSFTRERSFWSSSPFKFKLLSVPLYQLIFSDVSLSCLSWKLTHKSSPNVSLL